jgi:integrase/recombinase XerD
VIQKAHCARQRKLVIFTVGNGDGFITQVSNGIENGSKMRAWGEGTVQEVGEKFRGTVRINGKRHYGPVVAKKREALSALWKKIDAPAPVEKQPLSICVQKKIDSMTLGAYSPTTVEHWRECLKRILKTSLAELAPEDINEAVIQKWLAKEKGAARTKKNTLNVVLQVCREHGNRLEVKTPSVKQKKRRILTPLEQRTLLTLEMPESTRTMILLGLRMGLRRSEIAGLRHDDRDGDGVTIRRAVVRAKGIVAIKNTKTPSSEAWVPLCEELKSVIGSGEGYVLGDGDRPISPSVLDDRWRRFIKGKVYEGTGLHDLRATFGMTLLESGVDVRTASEMLRHDATMLLKVYTRSRRDLKRSAAISAANTVADSVAKTGLGVETESE